MLRPYLATGMTSDDDDDDDDDDEILKELPYSNKSIRLLFIYLFIYLFIVVSFSSFFFCSNDVVIIFIGPLLIINTERVTLFK